MNFDLDEDQRLFRDSVERFAGPFEVATRRARRAGRGYPRERWAALAELGLVALAAPAAAGGLGGSLIDLALVAETLGRSIAIDPWLENGFLPAALSPGVAGVLDGTRLAALAFAEPGRSYELAPSVVRATADGRLTGCKTLVLGGAQAEILLVTAQGPDGFALYAVAADATDIRRTKYTVVYGSLAAQIEFNDTLGKVVAIDLARFMAVVGDTRLLAAAEMLGLGQRLFDDTLAYVKTREQFGAAPGTFQALQHRLVECYAALEQARSLVWRTALAAGRHSAGWPAMAAGVKASVGASMLRLAEEAVQMHGGMGQTDELAVGHAFKRIILLSRLFGDQSHGLREYARAA